jgi:hypothetical protein
LAVLGFIVVPQIQEARVRAKVARFKRDFAHMGVAGDTYRTDYSQYASEHQDETAVTPAPSAK